MGKKQCNGDCIITLQVQTLNIDAGMERVFFFEPNLPILSIKA